MKLSILMLMSIGLTVTSCAQEKTQTQQTTSKEQTKTIAMQKVKMTVDGMTCSACQSDVKRTIKSIDGIKDVEVSLEKKFALFSFDPQKVKGEQVRKAVNDKGYSAGKPQEIR